MFDYLDDELHDSTWNVNIESHILQQQPCVLHVLVWQ